MSDRRIRYSAQNVIDYFEGNFDIPCDGAKSDIEGFEDDDSDIDQTISVAGDDGIMAGDDEIILPRYPDEGSEDENSDSGDKEGERGRPVHFTFEDLEWSDQKSDIEIPEFQGQVGPANILPAESSAKYFVCLLVDDRMLNYIVRETNKYAKQKLEDSGKDSSLRVPVNLAELKAFLGLFIATSFHSQPSLKDYWSSDWILGMPAFTKVMTRKRFLDLFYNMHVNDNSTMPAAGSDDFDKLCKIRPFLEDLKTNFKLQ